MPACRKLLYRTNLKWHLFHFKLCVSECQLEVQNVLLVTPATKYLSSINSMGFGKTCHCFKVTFLSFPTVTHFSHVENTTCDEQIAYKCSRNEADILLSGRHHACQARWIMHKFYILHKWLVSQLLTHNKMFLLCKSTKAMNALNFMKKVVVIHDLNVAVFHVSKTKWFPWFSIQHENE